MLVGSMIWKKHLLLCLFNRMMEQTALGFTVGIERKNYWDVLYKGDYTAYYITTG